MVVISAQVRVGQTSNEEFTRVRDILLDLD